MLEQANNRESKTDIKTRQHLMERSYARSTRYGYKRARWRRLWRVQIQEYLTATIQNMMILLRNVKEPAPALGMVRAHPSHQRTCLRLQELFCYFKDVVLVAYHFFSIKCYESKTGSKFFYNPI
jgi:hypothetical protein